MSNVQVKNLDPGLHEQLRVRAAAADLTISDYVLELIRRDLRTPSRRQWLTTVAALPQHEFTRAEVAETIRTGRAER